VWLGWDRRREFGPGFFGSCSVGYFLPVLTVGQIKRERRKLNMRPESRFSFRRLMLAIGLTLVVFGLYPYWWLDILTRLQGGRPGNEGEGMGGIAGHHRTAAAKSAVSLMV
jgi:hypothetical protein